MLKVEKDVVVKNEKRLKELQAKSSSALDLVTSTINNLATVNEEIDIVVSEINEAKNRLSSTENDLKSTKEKNGKIISKFKNLIGE